MGEVARPAGPVWTPRHRRHRVLDGRAVAPRRFCPHARRTLVLEAPHRQLAGSRRAIGEGRHRVGQKGVAMATSEAVRNYRHLLGQLAGAHEKARARLEAVQAKRSEVIAAQDQLVAAAASGVDRAVVDMAQGVGPELTAGVLGLDVVEVKRLVKSARQ